MSVHVVEANVVAVERKTQTYDDPSLGYYKTSTTTIHIDHPQVKRLVFSTYSLVKPLPEIKAGTSLRATVDVREWEGMLWWRKRKEPRALCESERPASLQLLDEEGTIVWATDFQERSVTIYQR